MGIYVWDECQKIGINSMDDQHEMLLGYIKELHRLNELDINGTKVSNEDIGSILKKLVEYTIIHFTEEEALMEQYDYPDLPKHKQTHETLKTQLEYLNSEFIRVGLAALPKLIAFLGTWLQGHINHIDQDYSHFIHEKTKAKTKAG